MKVNELFRRALALLGEDEARSRVFKRNCIPLINQLLAQCLSTENAIRESKGKQTLAIAGTVEGFDDVIPYDENFVEGCLAYGLAALFCADDDRSMSNAMGAQFEELKKTYHVVNYSSIQNCYQ